MKRSRTSSSDPCSRSPSAAPATAASTTPRATARPARPSARSIATRSRSATATSSSASCTRSETSADRRERDHLRHPWSTPGTHVDGIEAWLYLIVPSQVTGQIVARPVEDETPEHRRPGGARSARLGRRADGVRPRDEVVPLQERAAGHQLGADARLRDADRVHHADAHRRDPGDVLQAVLGDRRDDRQADRVLVDRAHHERPHARLARAACTAGGRVSRDPPLPAHGARVPVRRLQVPARAALDHGVPSSSSWGC